MIIGKDSWKYLVLYFVVLLVAIVTGIFAYNSTIASPIACKTFGILNMVLAVFWVVKDFKKHSND